MKNLEKNTEKNEVIENAEARDYLALFDGNEPEIDMTDWTYTSNLDFTYTVPGQ
jgi:hypothetical protein